MTSFGTNRMAYTISQEEYDMQQQAWSEVLQKLASAKLYLDRIQIAGIPNIDTARSILLALEELALVTGAAEKGKQTHYKKRFDFDPQKHGHD
jgi:hypothetical protein